MSDVIKAATRIYKLATGDDSSVILSAGFLNSLLKEIEKRDAVVEEARKFITGKTYSILPLSEAILNLKDNNNGS